jgi:hypothetical protein
MQLFFKSITQFKRNNKFKAGPKDSQSMSTGGRGRSETIRASIETGMNSATGISRGELDPPARQDQARFVLLSAKKQISNRS